MRGHIAKKGGRYYAVVSLGDPGTGKRRRKWIGGFTRRRDAERALTATLDSLDRGVYVEPSKQTLKQYLMDEWLPGIRTTIKQSTWDSYRCNVENHVIPKLGR